MNLPMNCFVSDCSRIQVGSSRTVSIASSVLPKFHPGFMPAKKALADMALNFEVEGHVTVVTFPDGNAISLLASCCTAFNRLIYLALRQVRPAVKLPRAPTRICSESLSLYQSVCNMMRPEQMNYKRIYTFAPLKEHAVFSLLLHKCLISPNIDSGTQCPDPDTTPSFIVPDR